MNIPGSGIQFWGVNTFKNKQVWLNSEYRITTDQNSGHLLNGFGDLVGYIESRRHTKRNSKSLTRDYRDYVVRVGGPQTHEESDRTLIWHQKNSWQAIATQVTVSMST